MAEESMLQASTASPGKLAANGSEGLVGVSAQSRNGGDAHDNDQGQHNRVFDGRRTVLALQESLDAVCEMLHALLRSWKERLTFRIRHGKSENVRRGETTDATFARTTLRRGLHSVKTGFFTKQSPQISEALKDSAWQSID
jgi:hypothetical protein